MMHCRGLGCYTFLHFDAFSMCCVTCEDCHDCDLQKRQLWFDTRFAAKIVMCHRDGFGSPPIYTNSFEKKLFLRLSEHMVAPICMLMPASDSR